MGTPPPRSPGLRGAGNAQVRAALLQPPSLLGRLALRVGLHAYLGNLHRALLACIWEAPAGTRVSAPASSASWALPRIPQAAAQVCGSAARNPKPCVAIGLQRSAYCSPPCACVPACLRAHVCVPACLRTRVFVLVRMRACGWVGVCLCVWLRVCLCLCASVRLRARIRKHARTRAQSACMKGRIHLCRRTRVWMHAYAPMGMKV